MGKYLATVWTAILFILLQTDVTLSEKKPKPSGGGWNAGSQLHPGYPPHSGSVQFNSDNLDEYENRPERSRLLNLNVMELAEEGPAGDAAIADYDDYSTTPVPIYFHFPNCDEERWWYGNRRRFTDPTYEPSDIDPVPIDVFVRDCVNATMRGHIKPRGNQVMEEMETRVGARMVHEICTERYRLYSRPEGGQTGTTDEVESEVLNELCMGAGVTVLLDMLCIITSFLFFLTP